MSVKKADKEQIDKYLKGKLDARAMHKLEREAQDDPFLMDALEGYGAAGEQDGNLEELKGLLDKRIAPKKERSIILWRVLPIAACLLIALMAGYWYFAPKTNKQQYANVVSPGKTTITSINPQPAIITEPKDAGAKRFTQPASKAQPVIPLPQPNKTLATVPISATGSIVYKTDTVEYRASDYKVRENSTVNELLKHMEGFQVDSNGNVSANGQAVTKARLNGKDYTGGNLAQAIQSLPADIVQKIQVVDDYGDQAARTGVKDGDPTKVLNITTDSSKRGLIAANKKAAAPALREVSTDKAKSENATVINGLAGKVAGLNVTQAAPVITATHTITGRIVSKEDGLPLPGATVKVTGTQQSVQTNADGKFSIAVPATSTLDIQYSGYLAQQVHTSNTDNLDIALETNGKQLGEVVVTGAYGEKREEKAAGYTQTHITAPDHSPAPNQQSEKDIKKLIVGKWVCKSQVAGNITIVFNKDGSGYGLVDSMKNVYKFKYSVLKGSILKLSAGKLKPETHYIRLLTATELDLIPYPVKKTRESISVFDTDYKRSNQ